MKNLIVAAFAFSFAIGCARDKSLDVYQPQQEFEKVTAASNEVPDIKVTPQVDILFVIDNSWSMKEEISNLSKNIPRFVQAFTKYQQLDFHIGVTTIWDTIRYQDAVINPNAPVAQFSEVTREDGTTVTRRNFWSNGELLPLVSQKSPDSLTDVHLEGDRFVSATTENLEQVLIDTLLLQPVEHIPGRDPLTEEYVPGAGQGPEFEELFSPVKEAFSNSQLNNVQSGANKGFSRVGAHKVVVFVTDADDESQNLTASQLDRFLRQLTNDNSRASFTTFSVMYKNEDKAEESSRKLICDYDPGLEDKNKKFVGADKLNDFMRITGGTSLSICDSDFGDELAKMGESVVEQALGNIVIPLERYPQYIPTEKGDDVTDWLKVFYGEQEVPLLTNLKDNDDSEDAWFGWSWDFDRNAIIIRGANRLTPVAGAQFQIQFTAVDLKNNQNGGVKQSF